MGQHVYLCFVKWGEKAKEKGEDYFVDTWLPLRGELCEEHGVKLLRWGLPFGVAEDHVYVYETDLPIAGFMEFKGAVSTVSGERLWDYSKTIVLYCPN